MHETEQINLADLVNTHLPLGYRKIHLEKIPPLEIENKLTLYNRKYHYSTKQVLLAIKPISKILK